jgi:hypothetical protein
MGGCACWCVVGSGKSVSKRTPGEFLQGEPGRLFLQGEPGRLAHAAESVVVLFCFVCQVGLFYFHESVKSSRHTQLCPCVFSTYVLTCSKA